MTELQAQLFDLENHARELDLELQDAEAAYWDTEDEALAAAIQVEINDILRAMDNLTIDMQVARTALAQEVKRQRDEYEKSFKRTSIFW